LLTFNARLVHYGCQPSRGAYDRNHDGREPHFEAPSVYATGSTNMDQLKNEGRISPAFIDVTADASYTIRSPSSLA
jgi:hypothetical protein